MRGGEPRAERSVGETARLGPLDGIDGQRRWAPLATGARAGTPVGCVCVCGALAAAFRAGRARRASRLGRANSRETPLAAPQRRTVLRVLHSRAAFRRLVGARGTTVLAAGCVRPAGYWRLPCRRAALWPPTRDPGRVRLRLHPLTIGSQRVVPCLPRAAVRTTREPGCATGGTARGRGGAGVQGHGGRSVQDMRPREREEPEGRRRRRVGRQAASNFRRRRQLRGGPEGGSRVPRPEEPPLPETLNGAPDLYHGAPLINNNSENEYTS